VRLSLAPLGSYDLGAALAAIIAIVALRAHSLDRSGAVAAFVVGTLTFGALGVPGAAVLLAFFVSSVVLSRIGKRAKRERLRDIGKTGARDAAQVLANGGIAAICAFAAGLDRAHAGLWIAGFCGAFAAAAADTWGTEIGTLARGEPRSIWTLRKVPVGISGGITLPGTLAEIAGAATIALVATSLPELVARGATTHLGFAAFGGGVAGALVDSLLGGSLQTLRYCPQCSRLTELEPHFCGANTRVLRGATFFGNDAVNFACTFAGAAVAIALAR
jgi:uncharacterized protein (TIGR00297 family)